MDNIGNLLFLLILCFFFYTPSKQSMHMYQQNRYQMKRYRTWLVQECKREKKKIGITFSALMGMYALFFVSHEELPFQLLMLLMMVYSYVFFKMEDGKEYRKPLVFTHRIQRLFVAFYSFYTVVVLFLLPIIASDVWIFMMPFLYFLPWGLLVLIGTMMEPVERSIRHYFVKNAKHLLRKRSDLRIVGITGSYGKTSVKNIMQTLLSDSFYTLMTPHSYNNMMGITLTIRETLQNLHEVFLCEMGADHVHEIEQLMDFVQPQYGVVTAVGPQHLSTFRTMENILHEKMQMIEKLPKDGIGFINLDNAYIRSYQIQNTCRIITYGLHENSAYRAMNIQFSKEGSTFDIVYEKAQHSFSTRLLGTHNVVNITCAIALAHTFHVPWEMIKGKVAQLDYVEHRLQIRKERYTILDNAYNSNPEGAHYALEVMRAMSGKKIIVTPGFLDLGKESVHAHQVFGNEIAACIDEVILVGRKQTKDIIKGLREKNFPISHYHVVSSIHEAFQLVDEFADENTIVLLENDLPDAFNH